MLTPRLAGKCAIVTGAASGIGATTAQRFADAISGDVLLWTNMMATTSSDGILNLWDSYGHDRALQYAEQMRERLGLPSVH